MKYKTYTKEQIEEVLRLFEDGKSKMEISRMTGINRRTLTDWISPKYIRKTDNPRNSYQPITDFNEYLDTEEKRKAYAFILGVYLCDGHICTSKLLRAPALRLTNDIKYIKNTQEWIDNISVLLPENSINKHRHSKCNANLITVYSRKLVDLFPQHGPGKKHQRKLELAEWQRTIINKYPSEFLRACFQSDGCIYTLKNGGRYYSFSNMSEDIMDWFLSALSSIGINKQKTRSVKSKIFIVQISKKSDVEILQSIIAYKE